MTAVSVIINCLNGEKLVSQAIQSVYAQTFPDWEIIFWDNASTDSTPEIARGFSDGRLRYFRSRETVPLGKAREWAIAEARGEWIAILDHDDRFLPLRLERQLAEIAQGNYVLSYCGYRHIDENGAVLGTVLPRHRSGRIFGELLTDFEVNVATVLMRRSALAKLDLAQISSYVMAEEHFLYMNLAARGDVCVVPEVLVEYRHVANSWTERVGERQAPEMAATLDQLERDFPELARLCAGNFVQARAKNTYTRARYEMQAGNHRAAQASMASIRHRRRIFMVLWLVSLVPPLWNLVHRREIKARLTSLFMN
jgi:glycosyltransferase involved in cell wall biosynthesis